MEEKEIDQGELYEPTPMEEAANEAASKAEA
jgi:hypothetical protein